MQGIDTNILIRFLIGDDALQAKKVYTIFKKAESEKNELFVPLLVMLRINLGLRISLRDSKN
jgi:predicted nucleic-acid-binding protein